MALGWITWRHYFESVLLNDFSNALSLCKNSEHRSEEVMVGLRIQSLQMVVSRAVMSAELYTLHSHMIYP